MYHSPESRWIRLCQCVRQNTDNICQTEKHIWFRRTPEDPTSPVRSPSRTFKMFLGLKKFARVDFEIFPLSFSVYLPNFLRAKIDYFLLITLCVKYTLMLSLS